MNTLLCGMAPNSAANIFMRLCTYAIVSQLIVASIQEDWEEKIDEETNKPYYVHVKTGESSWQDADERYANQLP